ncbi:MRC1-like domain-containing protein [Xylaria bambusicola]|uniref:MRC1-like domain-containing protein n=1 Tax=Xylaria bambusicola TaxID=326684 RepID=UPI0020082A74|nr:MRC1-like domain-containing protein [Xylaria bambusicola]KAI0514552.1 MRC1-like domain-containing protein [Xylaria bambusicola]
MSSPRASSPAGDASNPTSPQLTPRSKLKAMLAAVDDASSGDESSGPIDAKALFAAIDKTKQQAESKSPLQDDTIDEDEDTEIVKPRGRIAARMHANFTKTNQLTRASEGGKPRPTPEQDTVIQQSLLAGEADDEDDVIAPTRRRLARPDRQSTPGTPASTSRHSSPGLFVSPSPQKTTAPEHGSTASASDDDEMPIDLSKNARFKALVEKKRRARLDREAEEERQRMERAQRVSEQVPTESADEDDVSDISDDDGGRKLTQDISRPARKASKKALEEMNRETQRLSRSLQLAHEAKTKKKISKDMLFKKFNFRPEGISTDTGNKAPNSSRATTPASVHQTDAELDNDGTPPSSPPSISKETVCPSTPTVSTSENSVPIPQKAHSDHPSLEDSSSQSKDAGKDKENTTDRVTSFPQQRVSKKPMRQVRVKLPPVQVQAMMMDSDDELEITKTKKQDKLQAVLSRIPESKAQESTEMKILRNLAHLSSPSKEQTRGRNAKPSMTLAELQMSLQQRAKAQAKLERERRLELLRSKGIVVQSAEEREREREQVEDIVARARQEVEEVMMREREEAKRHRKEKRQNGEVDPLAWDDSDDDSFEDNEDTEAGEVEFSGSEEEDEEKGDVEDETAENSEKDVNNSMFMDEAEEVQSEDEKTPNPNDFDDFSDEDIEAIKRPTASQTRRFKKQVQIISDDEDEGGIEATPKPKSALPMSPAVPGSDSPKPPTSVLRSATKTFIPGLPIATAAPAGLGLTQIFAGTMDNSQVESISGSPQAFMPSLDQFPDSQFSATADQSQANNMIIDSQPSQVATLQGHETQTQGLQLHYSQSQAHGFDSLVQADATQASDFLDPTQDGGFQDFTPLKQRFVDPPPSTVGTVLLTDTLDEVVTQESPLVRKRGKLLRRNDVASVSPTLLSTELAESTNRATIVDVSGLSEEQATSSDAFKLMEKAAKREKRLKRKLDKRKSEAAVMIEEQAVESEDEYAGLGGADGEDSSDEDDELVKEMIDDTGKNDGDAAKLAGLFADRERAADAAQVDKLFRDITTGMLRKRRRGGDGHDFDLSDSDDGGEARRRMKRRQFAKMQKALFADERIGKIAENPRNAAFLKSIEDMNDDEEWNFDENFQDTTSSGDDSQSQNASQVEQAIPDSQPPTTGRKRSRTEDHAPRPGPNGRHTREGARPSSIAEVRRSLSTLLDEPNASAGSIIPATEIGSDSEGEGERPSTSHSNKENHRTLRHSGGTVVDRITLKRSSSSSLSTASTSTTTKLAFTAPATTGSGFKVPALLRRATTNSKRLGSSGDMSSSSTSQASASSTSGSLNKAASFGEDGKLKKNAGKRSGINYFAHENERRAKVAEAEKRREAKKWKGAEGRSKVVGGLFGSGSFE